MQNAKVGSNSSGGPGMAAPTLSVAVESLPVVRPPSAGGGKDKKRHMFKRSGGNPHRSWRHR